jgi:peroxiredoxin
VLTTNDIYVLGAWAEASGAGDKIRFVSDGNGEFVRKAGLDADRSARGMGTRSKRFAMVVDEGVVTSISVEDDPAQATISAATEILRQL